MDFGRCSANKLLGIKLSSSSVGYKEEEVISGISSIAGSLNKRCRITFPRNALQPNDITILVNGVDVNSREPYCEMMKAVLQAALNFGKNTLEQRNICMVVYRGT